MGRIKRYKWLLIVLTLCVAFGGVAYAGYNVAVIASSPSDQWHACVSNTGVVRVSTMRLNSYPATCPRSTDTVRSWNSSGPSGANGLDGTNGQDGATGPTGPTGPAGDPTTTTSSSSTSSTSSTTTTTAAPTTPYVSANIAMPRLIGGIAFDGSNLWATNSHENSIYVVNRGTGEVTQTIASPGPDHAFFDGTNMWVTNPIYDGISRFNPLTGVLLAQVSTGQWAWTQFTESGPRGVGFDGTSIWVANLFGNTVSKINAATARITAVVPIGSSPKSIAFDGTNIWVTGWLYENSVIYKVSPISDTVIATIAVPHQSPNGIIFDGTNIWVANEDGDSVSKIDPQTNSIIATVQVSPRPLSLAFDGTSVWVSNPGSNSISRINPATNEVTATVGISNPSEMVYDGASLWVVGNNVTGHLYRIDNL